MSQQTQQDGPVTLPDGLTQRPDGIYLDAGMPLPALQAAVDRLYQGGLVLRGLDYARLMRVLFGVGAPLPPGAGLQLRIADSVSPFAAQRKGLFRNVKIREGEAEYFFEPVFLPAETLPDGTLLPERPAHLDFDEFVAELWTRGIRFGIQEGPVRAGMAAPRGERVTAACELAPSPAQDAHVVEVASELHRSDAPRQRADGRLDLTSFQNRFPQIKHGARLLQKVPGVPGAPGCSLSGQPIAALQPADVDLRPYAGEGTLIEREGDSEFLVAARDGFLDVDPKSGKVSINEKIISREGVSGRTTGNLELMGAFEEFGDVQELRDVNGSDITVHGDVFGNIHSSGGTIVLGRNLVGGKAVNAKGDIRVDGVASGATLQAAHGTVIVNGRAESCVISASKVVIEEASNCEIFADEVEVKLAIGCAIAGRRVEVESAGPRKSSEMVLYVVVQDVTSHEAELAELAQQIATRQAELAGWRAEHERLNSVAEVRSYLTLADKLRRGEIHLTEAQVPQLKKVAAAVAPQVRAIGQLAASLRQGEEALAALQARCAELEALKRDAAARSSIHVQMVDGDVLVRTLPLTAAAAEAFHLQPKEYKALLRGPRLDSSTLFQGSAGSFQWHGANVEAAAS